mgnify:CR=1 FL=1|jgi:hypothetical protein|tara:strand:+ start:46 stop:354 length:309 start_codon:yes stop_codon:yes gene_type:complete
MKLKLKILAESAAEFYGTTDLLIRKPKEPAHKKHARNVCHWVACDAGYKKGVVAVYFSMDRSTIHYGVKKIMGRIDSSPKYREELQDFMAFAKKRIEQKSKP